MKTKVNTESKPLKLDWSDLTIAVGKQRCVKCGERYSLLYGNGLCERCLRKAGVFK
jgi:ribosomal protein S14